MFLASIVTQVVRGRWTRVGGGIAAIAILIAVPSLGFARLGSALLPSSAAEEDGGTPVAVANDVLVFDAPAVTQMRARSTVRLTSSSSPADAKQNADEAALLTDWRYTFALRSRVNPNFFGSTAVELALINVILAQLAFEEQLVQDLIQALEHRHHRHHHPSPHR